MKRYHQKPSPAKRKNNIWLLKRAVLDGDGRSFEVISHERGESAA